MTRNGDGLVEALRDRVGDALRVVGRHGADEWTVQYMRGDLDETYGTAERDAIADDLSMEVLAASRQEDLYDLGDVEATIRLFEDGFVVHVPTNGNRGVLVSLDADAGVTGRDVVDVVRRVESS